MSADLQRICPSCGNEFSGAMAFCPVCMLRKALAEGVESGKSSIEEAVEPIPEQVVQRFEHYELVRAKTGNRSNWVAVRWGSLIRRSISICTAR
jgi:hypothetical protein